MFLGQDLKIIETQISGVFDGDGHYFIDIYKYQ